MKNYRKMAFVFTIIAIFLMGAAVSAEDKKPSGTVHFEETQFMFLGGIDTGEGTLTFKGKKYTFSLSGITAGGAGIQHMTASGNVYDLNDVADFPGTYGVMRLGLTVAEGQGGLWLQNGKGVSMNLTTSQEGIALGTGVEGLVIEMK